MRLEDEKTLVLSERNLLSLLTKLYTENSVCTLQGDRIDAPFTVKAEPDRVHYQEDPERIYPPGPMHPVTEKIVQAVREATKEAKI